MAEPEASRSRVRRRHRRRQRLRVAAEEGVQAEVGRGHVRPSRPRCRRWRSRRWRNAKLISTDTVASIEAMIAAIDRKMSEQVNLDPPPRGFPEARVGVARPALHGEQHRDRRDLKIRVMAISKQDLGKTLKRYKGTAWDQSPLFKKLYEEEYGQFGGEPFGAHRRRLPLRPLAARRRAAGRDVQDRGRRRMPVHHRRGADGHADGFVGRAGQSARPDQDLH